MSEKPDTNSADSNEEIEREIRTNRKFSLTDAIGRLAGGGFMKGGSPVSRKRQAELEIEEYLRRQMHDLLGYGLAMESLALFEKPEASG